jgi:hypothetical protein
MTEQKTPTETYEELSEEEQSIIVAIHKAQMEAIQKYLEELIGAMKKGKILAITATDLEAMLTELRNRDDSLIDT